ncbi:MAG TPA: CidA/LrgA family protein [Burkholderiales bacterium]|nr:CidA/LrgA family protein [Burkholderiales bacterium]
MTNTGDGLHPSLIARRYRENGVIEGLVRILLFQGLGEVIAHFLLPLVPGPVIGLILLLAFLVWRGRVNEGVELVSSAFMRYLGLLFVPAAVGVVLYWPHLQRQALAIAVALLVSVIATIAVSALLAKWLDRNKTDAA